MLTYKSHYRVNYICFKFHGERVYKPIVILISFISNIIIFVVETVFSIIVEGKVMAMIIVLLSIIIFINITISVISVLFLFIYMTLYYNS